MINPDFAKYWRKSIYTIVRGLNPSDDDYSIIDYLARFGRNDGLIVRRSLVLSIVVSRLVWYIQVNRYLLDSQGGVIMSALLGRPSSTRTTWCTARSCLSR